jgi:hypothetical protein
MSNKGFDCTQDCTAHGQQILDAGYEFCARYYYSGISHAKTKLSRVEALHLSGMGIYLVAVFENAGDHAGYFSHAQGLLDGKAAYRYAVDVIQQPYNSPIYFAVDFDATEAQIRGGIAQYFQGIKEAFTHEALSPEPRLGGIFQVGDYGSGLTCRILKELRLVSFTWLAQSTGWAEYEAWKPQANIVQGMSITWNGISIDPDISNGNGGGFLAR